MSKCENHKPNNIWFDNIMSKEMGTRSEDVAAMSDRYNVNSASECNKSSADLASPARKRCKVVFDTGGVSINYELLQNRTFGIPWSIRDRYRTLNQTMIHDYKQLLSKYAGIK